jgi:hypothetical protein
VKKQTKDTRTSHLHLVTADEDAAEASALAPPWSVATPKTEPRSVAGGPIPGNSPARVAPSGQAARVGSLTAHLRALQ